MSLNWSRTPALLIEMGYMSNAREDVLLSTPSYQMKLAAGIYEGIAEYFGR
jgi:N-acetylmuramoyl-L-alanine amidase